MDSTKVSNITKRANDQRLDRFHLSFTQVFLMNGNVLSGGVQGTSNPLSVSTSKKEHRQRRAPEAVSAITSTTDG
jgi:sRNA-binding regulator protein Hfq